MERRTFFKKLAIASGTLAFAPTVFVPAEKEMYGSIQPLMNALIKWQHHRNRLLMNMDLMMGHSAKRIYFELLTIPEPEYTEDEKHELENFFNCNG